MIGSRNVHLILPGIPTCAWSVYADRLLCSSVPWIFAASHRQRQQVVVINLVSVIMRIRHTVSNVYGGKLVIGAVSRRQQHEPDNDGANAAHMRGTGLFDAVTTVCGLFSA